jgi:hypothetical protein
MFHELLVARRGFPVGEATWEPYSGMAVDVPEMVKNFMKSQDDTDMVRTMRFLTGLIGKCYALLRMRAVSISYAEVFLVISCGKVEYDKSS